MDDRAENRGRFFQKASIAVIAILAAVFLCAFLFGNPQGYRSVAVATANGGDSLAELSSGGSACALAEVTTGRILYSENGGEKMHMASTTKVLTALVVLESCALDERVTIPKAAVGVEGSSIYLKENEVLTVEELLYGLMLRSGNDSAVALALHAAGSIENFAVMMNERAEKAGATSSNFTNPHGLHDDGHYTTSTDLVKIAAAAMRNADFKRIVSTKSVTVSGEPKRYLQNKNKMLWNYEGATGVKTGYTRVAGRCLVAAAERDGCEYVAVALNTPPMWEKCAALLDKAFAEYEMHTLFERVSPLVVPIENGRQTYAMVDMPQSPAYPLTRNEIDELVIKTELFPLCAPLSEGEVCGKISVSLRNELIFSADLFSICNIKAKGRIYFR